MSNKTSKEMIHATSQESLIRQLSPLDIDVPLRHEGRTKWHTEVYCIHKFLKLLAAAGRFDFPLSLTREDRPDFVIHSGETSIGVEHTEIVPENKARRDFHWQKNCPDKILPSRLYGLGETKQTRAELVAEINGNHPTYPIMGMAPEENLAGALIFFVRQKDKIARKPGFKIFEANFLLVYDNWSEAGADVAQAIEMIIQELQSILNNGFFDAVFVLDETGLFEIGREGGVKLYAA